MRKLYLFLTVSFSVIVILLVIAFLYIDTHKHHIFYYDVKTAGKNTATIKLDKYVTEDRIIYRSVTSTPFHSTSRTHKRKLVLDKRNLRILDYNKKKLGERASMDIYLKRMDSSVSFAAIGHSNFAYLDRFPVDKDFILHEEEALLSYAGIVAKYDFKKRGLQTFQALTHSFALLPPLRQTVSLRLAGEKTINLGDKKIDSLHLILKLPDYKEISIWINKWAHTILKVESPRINFSATWTEDPKTLTAADYALDVSGSDESGYVKKDVSFKNKDISLEGTLTTPKEEGPHPAILLVGGPGPLDREALGMFTNLADRFALNGIAVLSFDKRGIGKSQGNFARFTRNDTIGDLGAALDFLAQEEAVDKERIGILGHSEGGYFASFLASTDQRIRACIIMAGMAVVSIHDTDLEAIDYFNKVPSDWDKEYLADITRSAKETAEIIQSGKDWILLMGKRVYLKKARLDLENKPLDVVRKLKIPTLILQGKKDNIVLPEHAKLLEEALKEGGNQNYRMVFFSGLGHFFGDIVQDGLHRTHLTTAESVMDAIVEWLKDNLVTAAESSDEEVPSASPDLNLPEIPAEPAATPPEA